MKVIIDSFILFMFVFSFKIPFFYNSSFLASFIALTLVKRKNLNYIFSLLKNKKVIALSLFLPLSLLYAMLVGTLQNSNDFSYVPIFLGGFVYYIQSILIISVVFKIEDNSYIFKLLRNICFIQGVIITFAFLSPYFHSIIINFQDSNQVEIASSYYGGGVRGLALSGGQFFNLSAAFSILITILMIANINVKNFKMPLLMTIFIFLTSLTTGRTVIIGFILGLACVLVLKSTRLKTLKDILLIFTSILILILITPPNIIPESLSSTLNNYSRFSFEFIHNYLSSGKIYTSSTDKLSTMYFIPELRTILFGDGMYTNADGSYYMRTDSGYMRNILLFGFFGLISLLIYTVYQVYFYSYNLFSKNKFTIFSITTILLLLLHYKGEVFGYLYSVNIIINLLFFYAILSRNELLKNKQSLYIQR